MLPKDYALYALKDNVMYSVMADGNDKLPDVKGGEVKSKVIEPILQPEEEDDDEEESEDEDDEELLVKPVTELKSARGRTRRGRR